MSGLIDRVLATGQIAGAHLRRAARREALTAIADEIAGQLAALDAIGAPHPRHAAIEPGPDCKPSR